MTDQAWDRAMGQEGTFVLSTGSRVRSDRPEERSSHTGRSALARSLSLVGAFRKSNDDLTGGGSARLGSRNKTSHSGATSNSNSSSSSTSKSLSSSSAARRLTRALTRIPSNAAVGEEVSLVELREASSRKRTGDEDQNLDDARSDSSRRNSRPNRAAVKCPATLIDR